jgi:hypothetical protein
MRRFSHSPPRTLAGFVSFNALLGSSSNRANEVSQPRRDRVFTFRPDEILSAGKYCWPFTKEDLPISKVEDEPSPFVLVFFDSHNGTRLHTSHSDCPVGKCRPDRVTAQPAAASRDVSLSRRDQSSLGRQQRYSHQSLANTSIDHRVCDEPIWMEEHPAVYQITNWQEVVPLRTRNSFFSYSSSDSNGLTCGGRLIHESAQITPRFLRVVRVARAVK